MAKGEGKSDWVDIESVVNANAVVWLGTRALGAVLMARIISRRDASGNFGDEQRTAQALSALDRLHA